MRLQELMPTGNLMIITSVEVLMNFAEQYHQSRVEPEVQKKAEEVTRKVAIKMLAKKGYRASSCNAFNKLMNEYGIQGATRSKTLWYKTADIESIPHRT